MIGDAASRLQATELCVTLRVTEDFYIIYSVHVRTRKFRNPEKTKRYVVPAPRANSKTQGGTRIDSDSICHRCHRHQSVFFGFSDGLSILQLLQLTPTTFE